MLRWTSLFTNRLPKGVRRKRRSESALTRRLTIEALEDRRMLAMITVTSAADNLDADGLVTLREAVQAANTDMSVDGSTPGNGADTINFAASLNGDVITLAGQELEITEALTVDATSLFLGVTIDAKVGSRIFNITDTNGDYTFAGLTLFQGRVSGNNTNLADTTYSGGAIRSLTSGSLDINRTSIIGSNTSGDYANGGGVFATGDVTLTDSTISNNNTEGFFARGGGLFTEGALTVNTSTISGNSTSGDFSAGGGLATNGTLMLSDSTVSGNQTYRDYSRGGGIYVSGTAIITQSTISGNSTSGFMSDGGGVASSSFFGQLVIHNSTIADNHVTSDGSSGGGVWNQIFIVEGISALVVGNNEDVVITNTIIATNTALGGNPDLRLFNNSLAVYYSLIGDTSGLTVGQLAAINSGLGNIVNVDPLLAALINNGGPTETHYLLPLSPALNMGDPTVVQNPANFDQRGTPFLRVYGGRLDIGALEVIVDDEGLRVNDVFIVGYPDYDLFDPKPSEDGPTPPIHQLAIEFIDFPVRDFVFTDNAVDTALAENEALYSVFGDASGYIPIQSAQVLFSSISPGFPAFATVWLTFFDPLPDDRFTLTVFDNITDPSGNKLDGESNAVQPVEEPAFPSGDGTPGGNFVARFTVDSRAEIGTWAAGSVLIDTNGNFIFDPANTDFTNRDLAYRIGFGSDYIFAGKFSVRNFDKEYEKDDWEAVNGGYASFATGFDTIAAYGRVSGNQYRWLIDTDDNGVADLISFEPVGAGINGYPVAGNFDGNPYNGDEVGLFDGKFWYFDTDHDFKVSDETPIRAIDYSGFPIAGDFDGDFRHKNGEMLETALVDFDHDGDDDVATYIASSAGGNLFSIDLNEADPGDPILIDGVADFSFRVGSPFSGGFGFAGARERPVAADFNADGIDDFGLWVPDGIVPVPNELSEWYLLLSGDDPFTVNWEVSVLDRIQDGPLNGYVPFSPEPFGNDLYAQFGNTFSLPIAGNFDPPVSSGPSVFVSQAPTSPPTSVPEVITTTIKQAETPPVVEETPEPSTPTVPVAEQQPVEEETVIAAVQVSAKVVPETPLETPTSKEVLEPPVVEEVVEQSVETEQAQATETELVQSSLQEEVTTVEVEVTTPETPEEVVAKQAPTEPEMEVVAASESVVVKVTMEAPAEEIPVAPVDPPVQPRSRSRVRSLSYGGSRTVASVSTQSMPPPVVKPAEPQSPAVVEIVVETPTSKEVLEPPVVEIATDISESNLQASEQSKSDETVSQSQDTTTDKKVPPSTRRSRTRTLIYVQSQTIELTSPQLPSLVTAITVDSQRLVNLDDPTNNGVDPNQKKTAITDAVFDDASQFDFNRIDAEVLEILSRLNQESTEEFGSRLQTAQVESMTS